MAVIGSDTPVHSESHPGSLTPGDGEPARPLVLLIEDDTEQASMLQELLDAEGYAVEVAADGRHGLHLGMSGRYDVILVDRGLPGLEGAELVRELRRKRIATPTIMITAWGTVQDRIEGLDSGVEDYLVKPFELGELLARIRAVRRRHRGETDQLKVGEGVLLPALRCFRRLGHDDVPLSHRESALLEVLAARPGHVFSRSELLMLVFDPSDKSGSVDTYVYYLRRKLGRKVIRTVRGSGYRIGT